MNDKKQIFPKQISEVRIRDVSPVRRININLAIPLTDHPYNISGNFFYIWDTVGTTDYIEVKVNNMQEHAVPYRRSTGQQVPFDTLYITTPAGQTGNLILLYGTNWPELVTMIDNRSAVSGDIASLLAELQGDTIPENWGTEITVGNAAAVQIIAANATRKACNIQAKSTNTGIVYIGFDNTVTTTKWIAELQAGMAFSVSDYRGDLYARADAVGQLVGWGEW